MGSQRVMVVGAAGRMGSEVVRAVSAADDLELVAAVDRVRVGEDVFAVAGVSAPGRALAIGESLAEAVEKARPGAAVDFTIPDQVMGNARLALAAHVPYVIGTSGLKGPELEELAALCAQHETPCLVVPNFAIGAVLMMQFAAQAARYFESAEIIELHHEKKLDSPSGTARATAALMAEARGGDFQATAADGSQPARGLCEHGVCVHSVRLPGLVAHQEVLFGGLGQTLVIRHDSINRESFMPGVLLALRKVRGVRGLVVGLNKVL